jgi:hypothetical protein
MQPQLPAQNTASSRTNAANAGKTLGKNAASAAQWEQNAGRCAIYFLH